VTGEEESVANTAKVLSGHTLRAVHETAQGKKWNAHQLAAALAMAAQAHRIAAEHLEMAALKAMTGNPR